MEKYNQLTPEIIAQIQITCSQETISTQTLQEMRCRSTAPICRTW